MGEKKNNSIIIILLIVLVIAAIVGGTIFFIVNNSNKGDDKDNKSTSQDSDNDEEEIENIAKKLAKAMTDEDKMDKFVDKYMDIKAIYAMKEVSEDYDLGHDDGDEVAKAFKKIYKNAEEEDYEDFSDEIKEEMEYFIINEEDAKVNVKKIGKLKEYKNNTAFQKAEITLEYDGNEETISWIFYNNKLVAPDFEDDSDEIETINKSKDSMNQQAIDAYNAEFSYYINDNQSATSIKALIQSIINSNTSNIDQSNKFVSLEIDGELSGEKDFEDLDDACERAIYNNNETNVKSATNEMTKIKTKINSSKKYDVVADYQSGIITKITIKEK